MARPSGKSTTQNIKRSIEKLTSTKQMEKAGLKQAKYVPVPAPMSPTSKRRKKS